MSDVAAFFRAMQNATPAERAYFKALADGINRAKETQGTPEYVSALSDLNRLTGGTNIYDNELLNNIIDTNGLQAIA